MKKTYIPKTLLEAKPSLCLSHSKRESHRSYHNSQKENDVLLSETEIDFTKTLKVLAIGNSFSEDGMAYMYPMAHDYGVENIVLGHLHVNGCDLSNHANNATYHKSNYMYSKNISGIWETTHNETLLAGLLDEDWDVITVQQVSGKSGKQDTYEPDLTTLIDFINENKTNPQAKIYWHLTWAYQKNCTHPSFSLYHHNQKLMYQAIIKAYQTIVQPHEDIHGLIPTGIVIQNIRTSYIGDTVTRDGYHLSYDIGRYAASLTWFKAITQLRIDAITYRPNGMKERDLVIIKKAVCEANMNAF